MIPAQKAERINSVDVLRGFALLGILLLNILAFGLPGPPYNPLVMGKAQTANAWTWAIVQIFFDGKMRALFSMLFGGSVVLMTSRAAARGADAEIADVWLRRSMWLMAIGSAHAWFLWDGDILFTYGLAGLFLYPFRKLSPTALIALGTFVLASQIGKGWAELSEQRLHKAEAEIASAVEGTRLPLTADLKSAKEAWEETMASATPPRSKIEAQEKLYRSGYLRILSDRAQNVPGLESLSFYTVVFTDSVGMMLIGMALLRTSVFTAQHSTRFYAVMAACGFLAGLPFVAFDTWNMWIARFDVLADSTYGMREELSRGPIALGFAALVMIACRRDWLPWLRRCLAAVGQTALTNYVLHSLICTTVFYGYGLGLYGKLERYQLYFVVIAVWVVQLVASPLWLRFFQYGPLEWVWRSLTYWQRQPLRVAR